MRRAAGTNVSLSESANGHLHFFPFLVCLRDDAEGLEGGEFTGISCVGTEVAAASCFC